jgi:hypothetical protein
MTGHPEAREDSMAEQLTADFFAPYLGKEWRPLGQPQVLTLAAVDEHARLAHPQATRTPFTLILRGARDRLLPEGNYRFAIDTGPEVELYVIPVHTPARDRQDYQIVFN